MGRHYCNTVFYFLHAASQDYECRLFDRRNSKKQAPLDTGKIPASTTRFFVAATTLASGETNWFTNDTPHDWFEVLRASKALPLLYGKSVLLGAEAYVDGSVSTSSARLVAKARAEDARTIILINTRAPRTWWRTCLLRAYASFSPPGIRAALGSPQATMPPCDEAGALHHITPPPSMPAGLLERSAERLTEAFMLGHQVAQEHDGLQSLFRS